jgi:Fe-S-cluster-containing hydrogenase component 2
LDAASVNTLAATKGRAYSIPSDPEYNLSKLVYTAPCVSSCPEKALIQRKDGLIVVDEEKCNGCGWCIEACDFGAISLHPETKIALICDLCGACECLGGPKCIEWCPEGALYLTDKRVFPQKARINAVKKLLNG